MEWILQNEVKKLTAESRIQLLESERKARSRIHALRYKIEDWVRTAENSLLQDLQDIVQTQEKKIEELENSVFSSEEDCTCQLKRRLIMKRLAFQPVIVTLETNENLENLLKQCSTLGTVKSVSTRVQAETTIPSDLNPRLETKGHVMSSMPTQDAGYITGRVAASKSEDLPRTKLAYLARAETNKSTDNTENYSYVDDVSSWLPVSNTAETSANGEETIPKTVDRRRKNTLRKSATVLMRDRNSLEDIKEEIIGNVDDDKLDSNEEHIGAIHKTDEGKRYVNITAYTPDDALKKMSK